MKNKGVFITCEGGEGSGKTTLLNSLHDYLLSKDYKVLKTWEPGATQLGKIIRDLLLYREKHYPTKCAELLLYLADRAQHVEELLLPALSQGQVVLCDRFSDSTLAYQGVARSQEQEGGTASLAYTTLQSFCAFASHNLVPNLTLLLDLDPKVGLLRTKRRNLFDRLENETLSFHRRVREAFLLLSQREPNRFYAIDASQQPKTVFKLAAQKIDSFLYKRFH